MASLPQSELTGKSQNEAPSTAAKKKRTNKGSSKVVELLDNSVISSGDPPVNEQADDNGNDELLVTGRQRGAKNYTLAELTLLNKYMEAAVPIGPQGIAQAINLYNRVAREKKWAIRGEKAL